MSTCRASLCRVAWGIFSNPHRGLGDRTTIVYPRLTDEETEVERGSIRKAQTGAEPRAIWFQSLWLVILFKTLYNDQR